MSTVNKELGPALGRAGPRKRRVLGRDRELLAIAAMLPYLATEPSVVSRSSRAMTKPLDRPTSLIPLIAWMVAWIGDHRWDDLWKVIVFALAFAVASGVLLAVVVAVYRLS